jgi:chromate reductase
MTTKIKILGLCGSLRADSVNLKLLRNFLAAAGGAFDVNTYGSIEMPLLNEDLEKKPLPDSILTFRAALAAAPVIVLACPEYNGSITPALKNAIDWGTRPPGNLWQGKIAVLLSASPGALGGARGLIHVRAILSGIQSWVIPQQVQCPQAHQAFTPEGVLSNEAVTKQIQGAVQSLEVFAKKMLG